MTKIYRYSKVDLYCVKTTFVFECRCRCQCWCRDADAEISKWPPEDFAFLILRILKLFTLDLRIYYLQVIYALIFNKSSLNVCKQIFHISHVRISQKVKGVLMWNLQHIIFIKRRRYWQIFISVLVYLKWVFIWVLTEHSFLV